MVSDSESRMRDQLRGTRGWEEEGTSLCGCPKPTWPQESRGRKNEQRGGDTQTTREPELREDPDEESLQALRREGEGLVSRFILRLSQDINDSKEISQGEGAARGEREKDLVKVP